MSRKERKIKAEKKRQNIVFEIAKIAEQSIKSGNSERFALVTAAKWVDDQTHQKPQEKSLYKEALYDFIQKLKAINDEKE